MKELVVASLLALTSTAWAQTAVKVEDAWVRGTVATQKATGAFMKLTSPESVRLVEASSPVAGLVEVHEMKMEGDVMRMRAMVALPLPSGQPVMLKPGGYHIMLMDLKAALPAGQAVPLTLVFEAADGKRFSQEVRAEARAMGAPGAGQMPGGGHGGHGEHGSQGGHKH